MSKRKQLAPIYSWLADAMSPEVSKALARLARTDGVRHIAVMPDIHLARGVCIGTVFASDGRVFPEAVGTDIGCGMAAMRFDGSDGIFRNDDNASKLLKGLATVVPANKHPLGCQRDWLPDEVLRRRLSHQGLAKTSTRDGKVQFGTLGRGNHFLEIQVDDDDALWLMVHSGSRAMGQSIAKHHLAGAKKSNSGLLFFEEDSEDGRAYLNDADWAVEYARANRQRIMESASMLIEELFGPGADRSTRFDSVHNFVEKERHGETEILVHRKGANSAKDGELSIIPGSMGTPSYHVTGRGSAEGLDSCSHGAGRAMSRSEARTRISEGQLTLEMSGIRFDTNRSRYLLDEAPGAYKDIEAVMRAQKDLIRRVRRLRPVLNYKG